LISVLELLLKDPRVDPTAKNHMALFKACENGHTDVVKLLVADRRINPSIQENVAARAAKWKRYSEIVNIFLADPRLDAEGRARLRKDLQETSDGFGSRGVVLGRSEAMRLLTAALGRIIESPRKKKESKNEKWF
jgi:Ankyrin repeats (3 copies)